MDIKAFIAWLKEPSTIKSIIVVAGLAGYTFAPAQVEALSMATGALYALVGAFYDRQPRKPPAPCDPPAA
jgi:hypothetical protein